MNITRLEVLVEEDSAKTLLLALLPKMAPSLTINIHHFQGKRDMLSKLPNRLRGFANYLTAEACILVLVDRDNDDCKELKARLEGMATDAGLGVRRIGRGSSRMGSRTMVQVVNRIVIEELEAWYFGDWAAVRRVYPRVSVNPAYRRPDAIRGGTWEAFERVLQRAGHLGGRLSKVRAAQDMARHMEPEQNTSPSFKCLLHGIRELTAG